MPVRYDGSTVTVYEKTSNLTLIGGTLTNATPSVFHQRHIGRVLRSSCNVHGRRPASSRGREPRADRCPPFWPGNLRNDGGSVAATGTGVRPDWMADWMEPF